MATTNRRGFFGMVVAAIVGTRLAPTLTAPAKEVVRNPDGFMFHEDAFAVAMREIPVADFWELYQPSPVQLRFYAAPLSTGIEEAVKTLAANIDRQIAESVGLKYKDFAPAEYWYSGPSARPKERT